MQQTLQIKNIETHASRVEQFNGIEMYDGVLARAVAELSKLWKWASPHLTSTGNYTLGKENHRSRISAHCTRSNANTDICLFRKYEGREIW